MRERERERRPPHVLLRLRSSSASDCFVCCVLLYLPSSPVQKKCAFPFSPPPFSVGTPAGISPSSFLHGSNIGVEEGEGGGRNGLRMDSALARARLMEVEVVRNVEEIRTSEGKKILKLLYPLSVPLAWNILKTTYVPYEHIWCCVLS